SIPPFASPSPARGGGGGERFPRRLPPALGGPGGTPLPSCAMLTLSPVHRGGAANTHHPSLNPYHPSPITRQEVAAMFDVLVRGGRVLDPAQNLDTVADVGIVGPRIAAIGTDIARRGVRREVVDAAGLLVTPGWVDLHTHVYWGVAPLGVEPDPNCLHRGVTTAVDAGSSG